MRSSGRQDMAETYVIDAPATPSIPVVGQKSRFPVHRIYCVGRNYAAHAREMGKDPEKEPPFFFLKPADAILPEGGNMHYPPGTSNLHHEIELVVALHRGGTQIPANPSTAPTNTSPCFTAPTPAGVPVKIRSPGRRV